MKLTGAHTWLIGGGQFILSRLAMSWDYYPWEDIAVIGKRRLDRPVRARITYGTPLGYWAGVINQPLPEPLGDILFTMAGEYFTSRSNILNYNYKNLRAETMLTKKWAF